VIEVEGGETILLYTDGWLEAGPPSQHRSSEDLAIELARLPAAPEELIGELRRDALRRSDGRLRDDMILLALRNRGDTGGGRREPVSAEVGA
jgi:serine phosphatase RsbU (regulator of sigma subunit)